MGKHYWPLINKRRMHVTKVKEKIFDSYNSPLEAYTLTRKAVHNITSSEFTYFCKLSWFYIFKGLPLFLTLFLDVPYIWPSSTPCDIYKLTKKCTFFFQQTFIEKVRISILKNYQISFLKEKINFPIRLFTDIRQ